MPISNSNDALNGDSTHYAATSYWTNQAFQERYGLYREYRYIIIHHTEGAKAVDLAILTGPLSVHKYVTKSGERYHLLDDKYGAYGCGVQDPAHKTYIMGEIYSRNENLATLQIEMENFGFEEFTEPQYAASAYWTANWCHRYAIPVSRDFILGHNQINKLKTDPNPTWDWERFLKMVQIEKEKFKIKARNSVGLDFDPFL
jgi:N-acetyl-anhydromuramyl-L-alanine amidase AmpD